MSCVCEFIKKSGEFNEEIFEVIEKMSKKTENQDYSLISIIGSQSSGKSTLLNYLFKTKFVEMDASIGRQRTTVGLWLGFATNPQVNSTNKKTFLIVDAEGTDSEEREKELINYEQQQALFSLILAEVILINIWETDIGRQYAANLNIIQNILYASLKLYTGLNIYVSYYD
jgi:GTPase Era involved in 16S rRNA processing